MSRIANDTAAVILALFAGQTVTQDDVFAQITLQYAMAKKRTGMSSYMQVINTIERAGATNRYTGPDYTGDCLYTFPASAETAA